MQLRPLPGHGQRKSLTTAELLRQMAERVMNSVGDHIAGIKRTTTPAAMTPTTIAPFNASSEYAQAHFAHAVDEGVLGLESAPDIKKHPSIDQCRGLLAGTDYEAEEQR